MVAHRQVIRDSAYVSWTTEVGDWEVLGYDMSTTDSHDRTKTSCKTPGRCDEENTFDGKRIKKERGDICAENGDAVVAATSISATPVTTATATTATTTINTANTVDKGQLPAGRSFTTNGFHGDGDPLQDLVATKFATLVNHSASSKQDKIRIMIEDGIRLKVNFYFKQYSCMIISIINSCVTHFFFSALLIIYESKCLVAILAILKYLKKIYKDLYIFLDV